jgi:hypothetical protein
MRVNHTLNDLNTDQALKDTISEEEHGQDTIMKNTVMETTIRP